MMSGYNEKAAELIDLIGEKKALSLCNQKLSKAYKCTEKYDKWRKIKRFIETGK